MTHEANKNKYDLSDRTSSFGKDVIALCKTIESTIIARPIMGQLIRSGTSIGG